MIQTGKREGMTLMDQSIASLLMAGVIDVVEAQSKAQDKAAIQNLQPSGPPQGSAAAALLEFARPV